MGTRLAPGLFLLIAGSFPLAAQVEVEHAEWFLGASVTQLQNGTYQETDSIGLVGKPPTGNIGTDSIDAGFRLKLYFLEPMDNLLVGAEAGVVVPAYALSNADNAALANTAGSPGGFSAPWMASFGLAWEYVISPAFLLTAMAAILPVLVTGPSLNTSSTSTWYTGVGFSGTVGVEVFLGGNVGIFVDGGVLFFDVTNGDLTYSANSGDTLTQDYKNVGFFAQAGVVIR